MRTLDVTDPNLDTGAPSELTGKIATGLDSLRQRVRQRLLFWAGTWFLDTSAGVPYTQNILGASGNVPLITQMITDQILDVSGVQAVRNVRVSYDGDARHYTYSATVTGSDGTTELTGTLV